MPAGLRWAGQRRFAMPLVRWPPISGPSNHRVPNFEIHARRKAWRSKLRSNPHVTPGSRAQDGGRREAPKNIGKVFLKFGLLQVHEIPQNRQSFGDRFEQAFSKVVLPKRITPSSE